MCLCDNKVLVLADDFTGANDAGVCLADVGMRVEVVFNATGYQGAAQALILNSDSRALSVDRAATTVLQRLAAVLEGFRPLWTIKKIDSTLRGNIGGEIDAMMQALGCSLAILAPAFPSAGRTTRQGHCYVHGQLITDTEFASDPKTPVTDASLARLVAQQSTIACHNVTVQTLGNVLRQADECRQLLIVDAETDSDLDAIVATAAGSEARVLLVGSAGLCEALARRLAVEQRGPLLAVVGSMSEIAQRQIASLADNPRVQRVTIDVAKAFTGDIAPDVRQIVEVIRQGKHCVVSTALDANTRHGIDSQCHQRGITRAELGEQICRYLAQVVQRSLDECQPGALYLSGGDVAIAVASALNATGFQITGRVAQCVPFGHFLGSSWQRPVMTKAGGFGSETTLREVVDFIEERIE